MKFTISMKWLVLWSLWLARLVRQPTLELRVSSGLLRGSIAPNGKYAEYLGVPYATVEKRFQAAQPVPPWEGTYEAYNENIRCTQRYTRTAISGREDCLTLNVYAPLPQAKDLKPVMVFIHGGGFRDGSGSPLIYAPDYLIQHDVIQVTINYRLEILGFLCLGIEEAPGNLGLKDQNMALKWVQQNIKVFGGDPDNVTIFGESAGSASVMYHLLSPMSEGLFHKAILQSGSAMSPWSFQYDPLSTASSLAEQMGFDTKDPFELYKIFMSKTATQLLSTRVPRKKGEVVLSENIFVPCVEKKLPGVEHFLTEMPFDLLTEGKFTKVPMIVGFNDAEGFMFIAKENDTTIEDFNFYDALPRDLHFSTKSEALHTAERLRKLYTGDKTVSKDTLEELARYEGDSGITYPVIGTLEIILKNTKKPVFVYKFCHDGWLNLAKISFGMWGYRGATHADELFYMFKTRLMLLNALLETNMIWKVSTMWSNFAKFGNPTPEPTASLPKWEPVKKDNPQVHIINKEISSGPLWDDHIILFWNETYSKYRRKT